MNVCRQAISIILLFVSMVAVSHAAAVNLIGGVADPYNMGIVPVPPNEPIPFSQQDLSLMTDNNTSTGFKFTSNAGDYSSASYSVVGFGKRYDFDISGYSSIEQIDFTWSGRYTWGGNSNPNLRFGPDPSMPIILGIFGTALAPDNLVHTFTVSFTKNATGFDSLANVLHGDTASYWAYTDLGYSTSGSTITFASVETLEVGANVIGTVVPIPAALPLFVSALGLVTLVARRKN